jgi:hypothetical protein
MTRLAHRAALEADRRTRLRIAIVLGLLGVLLLARVVVQQARVEGAEMAQKGQVADE